MVQLGISVILVILFQSVSATQLPVFDSGNKVIQNSLQYFDKGINLSNNSGHSEYPHLAADGSNVYVIWNDDTSGNRDIYFKRSTNDACTFSETLNISNQSGSSLDQQIAVSGKNVYVIWEHIPENNGRIFFVRSTDSGANFEEIKNLGNNTGFNGYPQIAVSGRNVYLVWHDASHGILFTRSTDSGANFDEIKNLGNSSGNNGYPQIAVSGSNVYVIWTSNIQEKNGQIFFTRSTDNGDNFKDPIALGEAKKDEIGTMVFRPQLTLDSKNNVHVVWHSGRIVQHADVKALITDIQYIRSTNGGESFGRILNLSNYSGWSINPQIATSQNNNVYVVWTNNVQEKYGKIFFTKGIDNGDNFAEIKNIDNETGSSGYPQIAVSGNNVYLVWHDAKHGILFARSTDNGDNFESLSLSNNYFDKSLYPQIAVSQNNNAYVAWANNATGNEEIILKRDTKNNNCTILNVGNRTKNLYSDTTTDDLKSKKSINIALVDATFTTAAYDKSFYMFYEIYHDADGLANITKYTDLLFSKVVQRDKISSEYQDLVNHLKWLSPNSSVDVLTDEDVHNASSIFANKKTNIYDVIILGHQEYVTQQEYDNLKRFVANGGTLILLNGNVLYNQVNYDKDSKMLTFVKGHGYYYDGKSAQKSTNDTWDERWKNETRRWLGSNYLCCYDSKIVFRNDPFGITHNEEQHITNKNAKILIDYNATKNQKEASIATYLLEYKKGKVIGLGIWTDDKLLKNERFFRLLDSLFFQYVFND
jgi:hypothetical protein